MADRYDRYLHELMRVHISWLTPAWIKNRDRFDAKVWVDSFRGAGIENVLFYSKFHDGYCTWPSKYRETAPERDFVGEITKEATKSGLGVSLYHSVGPDRWSAEEHPEWACLDQEGNIAFDTIAEVNFPYGCPNSGYRELLLGQIKELVENYDITGFWLDVFTFPMGRGSKSRGCFCKSCRSAYVKWSGGRTLWEAAGTVEHEAFQRDCLRDLYGEIKEIANGDGVRRPVSFNDSGGLWIFGPDEYPTYRELDCLVDYLSIEGFGASDPRNISFNLRLARSDGKPFESISTISDNSISWTPRNTDLIILEGATITSHGGTYMAAFDPTPDGHIFGYQIEQVAQAKAYLQEREGFLTDTEPVYDVAVWGHKKGSMPLERGFSGWGTALLERHSLFGFLYPDSELERYPLVIVDGTYPMDKGERERFVDYVEGGGNLIVEYSGGGFGSDDRFEEMLGVKFLGESGYDVHYLNSFEDSISAELPDYPILVDGPAYRIVPTTAKVLATYQYPHAPFSRSRSVFRSLNPPTLEDSRDAAITVNEYGKGRVVYLGCALGDGELRREKSKDPMPHSWPKYLADHLVALLIGEEGRSLQTDAPPGVEVILNKQGDRYILHLMNYYLVPTLFYDTPRGSLTLANINVKVNEKKLGRISAVSKGVEGETVSSERQGDWLNIPVSELSIHEFFVLDSS